MLGALFKTNADKTAATIAKFEAEHDDALRRLQDARAAYGSALVDQAEGLTDQKTVNGMRHELAEIESQLAAKATALAEAQRRHAQAIAASHADTLADRWTEAQAIAGKRHEAALRLAEAATAFAEAYRAMIDANAELVAALPSTPDAAAALLVRDDLERALKLDLVRHGITWAISWPWGREDIEPFTSRMSNATAVVESWAVTKRH